MVDGHIQGHHAVATVHIGERAGVNTVRRNRRVTVRPMPDIAVAFRNIKVRRLAAVVDGHVQGHHTVAAAHVAERTRVNATGRNRRVAVGLVPDVAITFRHVQVCGSAAIINCQVHGHQAVATFLVLQCLGIVTGLRIRCTFPCVTVTCRLRELRSIRIIYGQRQRHHAVATVGGGKGLRVNARADVGHVGPCIAVASGLRERILLRLVHHHLVGSGAHTILRTCTRHAIGGSGTRMDDNRIVRAARAPVVRGRTRSVKGIALAIAYRCRAVNRNGGRSIHRHSLLATAGTVVHICTRHLESHGFGRRDSHVGRIATGNVVGVIP